jgi:hypothetical protein
MERRSAGARNWLIVVGLLIVAGIAAYFIGRALEHEHGARDAAATKVRLQSAQTQIASLQSFKQLLNADVWAYRAAVALDNRNFGVANDAVATVVASLNAVDPSAAGLDSGSLAALKSEAAAVKISVATNLEFQRAQLIHLADDITALSGRSADSRGHHT